MESVQQERSCFLVSVDSLHLQPLQCPAPRSAQWAVAPSGPQLPQHPFAGSSLVGCPWEDTF